MAEPMGVVKGTLDLLVLKALSWQPMHGFEVTAWLERRSGKRLALEDGFGTALRALRTIA